MITWLLIIVAVSLFGIATIVIMAICRAGAYGDYYMALEKCKKCIYFVSKDDKLRLIYCRMQGTIIPELVFECKKGRKNDQRTI